MTSHPPPFSLAGKKGLILGLANEHSIAWGCAQMARQQGAEVVASCLNAKAVRFVEPLTGATGIDLKPCDVEQPGELQALVEHAVAKLGRLDFVVHSIAWAPLEEIAQLCTFLCTDASSGMTGQTIYVDAGCHAVA